MNHPLVINSNGVDTKSMDYEYLLEKGIEYIQQLSGNNWTDYNYHDPGITILEQLCYALTDLGYRTNFSIVDLLLTKRDQFDLEKNNLLHGPEQVFPSSPLTIEDISKLLIERVDHLRNVWVNVVTDSKFGFNGLYDILVQADEDVSDDEIDMIKTNIKNELLRNRALCTDLNQIKILSKDLISIEAKIHIDSFVLGEQVLAFIYHKIETIFNPNIDFLDIDEMLERGYSIEKMYSGTKPKFGFVEPNSLRGKTSEIYISEIQEVIENIEGVVEIDEIVIYKNGVRQFEDLISFSEETYPYLEKPIHYYNQVSDKIIFYRNQKPYEIDAIILSQLYDSLSITEKNSYKKKIKLSNPLSKGHFSKEELEEYFSIQNEFPSIYKLKEHEIGLKTENATLGQVKQLKAFLYLTEQLMANYLSQLSNLREYYSIDKESINSYFSQLPKDIYDLESIFKSKDSTSHLNSINSALETKSSFLERKNDVLDHLLARFSEAFDTSILSKLMHSQQDTLSSDQVGLQLISIKKEYANRIVELGRDKIKAFNYGETQWDSLNISGLEFRLKYLLGLQHHELSSLVTPLIDAYNDENSEAKFKWKTRHLRMNNGPELKVIGLTQTAYNNNESYFYSENSESFKALFLEAHKKKNFKIIEVQKSKGNTFCLLFNSNRGSLPTLIYESLKKQECAEVLEKTIKRFKAVNIQCEGMFLLEHLLLRPTVLSEYEIEILDQDKNTILKSFESGSVDYLSSIKNDIYVIATNPDNYLIEKNTKTERHRIVIYDVLQKPKYTSFKEFDSQRAAKKEIKKLIAYFQNCKNEGVAMDQISTIEIEESNTHEFPSNFNYSNHMSLLMPSWPNRFQNDEFKSYVKSILNQFSPAHAQCDIYYLDIVEMAKFEEVYMNWIQLLNEGDYYKKDRQSLQLIQLINSYNKE